MRSKDIDIVSTARPWATLCWGLNEAFLGLGNTSEDIRKCGVVSRVVFGLKCIPYSWSCSLASHIFWLNRPVQSAHALEGFLESRKDRLRPHSTSKGHQPMMSLRQPEAIFLGEWISSHCHWASWGLGPLATYHRHLRSGMQSDHCLRRHPVHMKLWQSLHKPEPFIPASSQKTMLKNVLM